MDNKKSDNTDSAALSSVFTKFILQVLNTCDPCTSRFTPSVRPGPAYFILESLHASQACSVVCIPVCISGVVGWWRDSEETLPQTAVTI